MAQVEGRRDLAAMQKDLSVAVVFCESNGHVLLVGAKAKLSKKCFAPVEPAVALPLAAERRDVAFEMDDGVEVSQSPIMYRYA